ncbi:unnamed protein product [Rotaria sp. Silwood2]|nr:unnamed protein product [Rotaria sp. Silwood2]
MNRSIVNIMNLPGEINLIIWNKLNKIDALYSFLNVNRRFDKLIRDKIYTCSIELIKTNFEEEDNCSLSDQILDRFCLDILPQIHYIVEQLILESFSMERILYAGDYPRLCKLTLINLTQEVAMRDILHLKYFSLTSYNRAKKYNSHVVPLLRRMIYLEQLTLCLTVTNRSTFVDGILLNNEILDHMPQLQTFNFNIITRTNITTYVNKQLYEDTRFTFFNGKFHQVEFYLDQYPDGMARSHIYSLPYKMNVMHDISNNFPGGYLQIHKRRNYKTLHEAKMNNQMSSVIVFPHLDICFGNIDIVEQLLVDTNTLLPRLIDLPISYSYIEEVTEIFTREATRRNCANIKQFHLYFSKENV